MNAQITSIYGLKTPYFRASTALYLETKYAFLRAWRNPAFCLPTLLFPSMFFVLFGIVLSKGKVDVSSYTLATYLVFGVMGPGLFGFGMSVALDREQGLLKWRRAMPAPAFAYFASKVLMAMLFAVIIFAELGLIASLFAGVRMGVSQWLQLLVLAVLVSVPFCALGLLIGTLVGGQAAPAIINFIYLPMSFLSGLWIPAQFLPAFLREVIGIWPSYHAAQLALSITTKQTLSVVQFFTHFGFLLCFTLLMFGLATLFWRKMELR